MNYEYLFRIVILGDSCSGKTSFMNKYISNETVITHLPTIGVDFNAKIFNGPENKRIKLHLWDTSGNKNFRSIARSYFGGVAGAIILYDVGFRDTFTNLTSWLDDFRLSNTYTDIPVVLLGANFGYDRHVSRDEGEYYARNNNLLYDEIDFTNPAEISSPQNDILRPLWEKIWNTFVKGNKLCLGIKKYDTYKEPREASSQEHQQPFMVRMKKELMDHIDDLKPDRCVIA